MKTKQELRTLCRQARRNLTVEERETYSKRVAQLFLGRVALEKPKVVHLFLPISALLEINTGLILEGLNFQYPDIKTVTSIIAEDQVSLLTVEVRYDTPLIQNAWGIPEPQQRILFDEQGIDEVLTPLLATDYRGVRLGYGKGFYDRFFEVCPPGVVKTGLNFFKPLEEEIPKDSWDQTLDRLIFPDGMVKFS